MSLLIIKGVRYYPVANWYNNQHKIEYCYNKAYIKMDDEQTQEAIDWYEKVEELYGKFNSNPRKNGIVFAKYEDYKILKDILGYYDWVH